MSLIKVTFSDSFVGDATSPAFLGTSGAVGVAAAAEGSSVALEGSAGGAVF